MPGSPPRSTNDPGTMPPPRTRSNSSMPVEIRACCSISISEYKRAVLAPPPAAAYRCPADAPETSMGRSSTNEFQAPQSLHCPDHLADCAPHSWQTKTVLDALLNDNNYRASSCPSCISCLREKL